MNSKNSIRNLYKMKRLQLGPEERHHLSDKITKNVLKFVKDNDKIQFIHVFLTIEKLHEVNTFPLIKALQDQGKEMYTSVSDLIDGQMKTVKLAVDQAYAVDKYGIPVPAVEEEGNAVLEEGNNVLLQLIFIPLLAYDLGGHRLGYGKGFYDRFLSELSPQVLKVGLSFFSAEIHIPTEGHDVRMDFCINAENVFEFKG